MPEIRPDLDMWAGSPLGAGTSWASARNHAGDSYDSNNSRDPSTVLVAYATKGGTDYFIRRTILIYNTSSITSTLSSASIDIHGFLQTSLDIILVQAVVVGSVGAGYFNDIKGTDASTALGNTDGSGAGTLAGAGVAYSSEVSTWVHGGVNQISLNSLALTDIVAEDYLQIIMMGYDADYLDIAPTGIQSIGNWWDESGSGTSPTLNYTVAVATATDNAIFFGANF